MSRKALRSPLKLLAATSVSIFSLLTVFTSTAAWFDSRRSLDNGGDNFEVQSLQGALKQLTIHELADEDEFIYDSQTKEVTGYVFNSTPASTVLIDWNSGSAIYDHQAPALGKYSLLQKTNPLLLVFTLNDAFPANEICITAVTSRTYTAAHYESMASGTGNPLSWVVKYSSLTKTAENLAASDFTIMSSALSNEGHFADISDEGTFNGFEQNETFFSSTSETNIRHVFVVLDYYANAMEYFYAANLGKAFLNDFENNVPFNIDWIMTI